MLIIHNTFVTSNPASKSLRFISGSHGPRSNVTSISIEILLSAFMAANRKHPNSKTSFLTRIGLGT
jgi:hypothetical protein